MFYNKPWPFLYDGDWLHDQDEEEEMTKNTTQNDKSANSPILGFFIAGVQHHQMHKILDGLDEGGYFQLVAEPTNKFDPNAVRIECSDVMCGYVPKKFSSEVAGLIEIGTKLECVIERLDKKAKPWEQCFVHIMEVEDA